MVCQTGLVEELLKREIAYCDDIANSYDLSEPEEPNEVYEWWVCDRWLLGKLEAHGQPVLHSNFGDWWGRTCTGQAIALDGVIEEIYQDTGKYNG